MSTIPRHLGKYELQQQLGRGSVGEVWKAYNSELERDVAIKIIHTDLQADPNFLTRFTQEGKALISLQHSNIVQIRDVTIFHPQQSSETIAYLVMDYIEGQTLADYIHMTSHVGVFPPISQILYLFTSLGVAIDYAHQKGIVHGNIKPSNILLDKQNKTHFNNGEPMLTDFGLTELLGSPGGIGTPLYMSPEQARGGPANNRSDVYSLGVILYELCTGVPPFRDESSVAVMIQHINASPTPPSSINPNIPPALSEVILRAMAKDTATRFPMASLLAVAVADACSMQSILPAFSNQTAVVEQKDSPSFNAADFQASIFGDSQPMQQLSPRSSLLPARFPTPMTTPSGKLTTSQFVPTLPAQTNHAPVPSNRANIQIPTPSMKMQIPTPSMRIQVPTPSMKIQIPTPSMRMQVPTPSMKIQVPTPSMKLQMYEPLASTPPLVYPLHSTVQARERSRTNDVPLYIVVATLLLLLVVIGSALGASILLNNKGPAVDTTLAGHVFFQDDALGHNDQLRIEMQNVPASPSGTSYFAWLQDLSHHSLLLGQLRVQGDGTISYLYPGNTNHANLLSTAQNLIITAENTTSNPKTPTGNTVYQATINTAIFPYIRNILYAAPDLPGQPAIVAGLTETIQSMNDKAGSIADSLQFTHDYGLAIRQATRVIEIIDGTQYAIQSGDLPVTIPPQINTQIGLLSSPTQPGYIDALATQLDKIQKLTDNDPNFAQHVQNVRNAITNLKEWIQNIRTYDTQILHATDLTNPDLVRVALLLKSTAADAYTGRTIPPNQGPQPTLGSAGAYQAYIEAQYMAELEIKKV